LSHFFSLCISLFVVFLLFFLPRLFFLPTFIIFIWPSPCVCTCVCLCLCVCPCVCIHVCVCFLRVRVRVFEWERSNCRENKCCVFMNHHVSRFYVDRSDWPHPLSISFFLYLCAKCLLIFCISLLKPWNSCTSSSYWFSMLNQRIKLTLKAFSPFYWSLVKQVKLI
jgi:hypothetical protein